MERQGLPGPIMIEKTGGAVELIPKDEPTFESLACALPLSLGSLK
jgi:hypothetical protein